MVSLSQLHRLFCDRHILRDGRTDGRTEELGILVVGCQDGGNAYDGGEDDDGDGAGGGDDGGGGDGDGDVMIMVVMVIPIVHTPHSDRFPYCSSRKCRCPPEQV